MPRAKDRPAPPVTAPAVAPETLPEFTADTHARWLPIAEVRKWDKNPRINAEAIPKVADSIRRFGVVAPAVVWEEAGRLVAGHTRIAALESILAADPTFVPKGASPGVRPGMIPVRFHPFASEAEADAYAIADNRLNEIARWDVPVLQGVLTSLDVDLAAVTGFDVGSLALPTVDSVAVAPGVPAHPAPDEASGGELIPPASHHRGDAIEAPHLRFGRIRVPMLAEDAVDFEKALDAHAERFGGLHGFVRRLLAAYAATGGA